MIFLLILINILHKMKEKQNLENNQTEVTHVYALEKGTIKDTTIADALDTYKPTVKKELIRIFFGYKEDGKKEII